MRPCATGVRLALRRLPLLPFYSTFNFTLPYLGQLAQRCGRRPLLLFFYLFFLHSTYLTYFTYFTYFSFRAALRRLPLLLLSRTVLLLTWFTYIT
jgi:hypothetical protein